ncbi:helix-turn-helix transcriptional regulator [Riemerella anatipestifer]|nr:helix-turn-helix transcriptional regulator [Riemerella anatipestifer]MCD5968780.1 helix-turn-helix domain-containing protein [Riemerella anatipestifer]MCT6763113.1 helix-turn-helix domain-containing protein [Riemerella anatipestifer]MCW0498578.1 helix-turn-helix domain-containing protein [Riemerella anatipestifer]MDR7818178.1 helix-turn-helix transcriptional regulator [Riemerella anatipestifer]MDR7850188.1 helix-turn-helix transcriptional regulator [Riemerella anatipestifer]
MHKILAVMTYFGTNIKKIRQIKGLSQQAFADMLNLTRGIISSYEDGRAEPKVETLLRIAQFLDMKADDLISKPLTVNQLANFEEVEDLIYKKENITESKKEFYPVKVEQSLFTNVEYSLEVTFEIGGNHFYQNRDILLLKKNYQKSENKGQYLIFAPEKSYISCTPNVNEECFLIVGCIYSNRNTNPINSIMDRLDYIEKTLKIS